MIGVQCDTSKGTTFNETAVAWDHFPQRKPVTYPIPYLWPTVCTLQYSITEIASAIHFVPVSVVNQTHTEGSYESSLVDATLMVWRQKFSDGETRGFVEVLLSILTEYNGREIPLTESLPRSSP